MANAIITEEFRKNQAQLLIDDITKTATPTAPGYYIGIGKSDRWGANDNPPEPTGSKIEKQNVINNLQSLAKIEANGINKLAVKTNQLWEADLKFKVYDPGDLTCFNTNTVADVRGCYCYYEEKIYLCLGNGAGGQSVASAAITKNAPSGSAFQVQGVPGQNGTNYSDTGTDGYIWVQIGDFVANSEFTESNTFFELPTALTSGGAFNSAQAATAGLIHGFAIRDAGSYNVSNDGIVDARLRFTKLSGDAGNIGIKAEISNGQVTRILNASGNDFLLSDFNNIAKGTTDGIQQGRASVTITGAGVPSRSPVIDVLVAPSSGYACVDNLNVFPPFFIGLTYDFNQNQTGDALTDITFRQVSIIKNPLRSGGGALTDTINVGIGLDSPGNDFDHGADDNSAITMDSLRSVPVTNGTLPTISTGDTTEGWYMIDISSGKQAWIDYIDNSENRIYFHQNTSFKHTTNLPTTENAFNGSLGDPWPSEINNPIKIYNAGGGLEAEIEIGQINEAEHVENTGEVIFLENRSGIRRTSAQTEKVRIILQL